MNVVSRKDRDDGAIELIPDETVRKENNFIPASFEEPCSGIYFNSIVGGAFIESIV